MDSFDNKRPNDTQALMQIRQFARKCCYEQSHADQVLKLSELLFEKLVAIHGLNCEALFILRCAAILHDIGWINGQARHHKTAMRLILDAPNLPLSQDELKMVALVARYHRKSSPKPDHWVYRDLPAEQQRQVQLLGGILRIADGLDRTHQSVVEEVDVRISNERIELGCRTTRTATAELAAAKKNATVFEKISGRELYFE